MGLSEAFHYFRKAPEQAFEKPRTISYKPDSNRNEKKEIKTIEQLSDHEKSRRLKEIDAIAIEVKDAIGWVTDGNPSAVSNEHYEFTEEQLSQLKGMLVEIMDRHAKGKFFTSLEPYAKKTFFLNDVTPALLPAVHSIWPGVAKYWISENRILLSA